ncbi:hypothetical protein QE152_g40091 [Popillia japonica]|uniref:Uncharacterized protein n=1 Tax=Popillia japonica TaxID=7064 RepID=A0AAW1HSE2_POPJA
MEEGRILKKLPNRKMHAAGVRDRLKIWGEAVDKNAKELFGTISWKMAAEGLEEDSEEGQVPINCKTARKQLLPDTDMMTNLEQSQKMYVAVEEYHANITNAIKEGKDK